MVSVIEVSVGIVTAKENLTFIDYFDVSIDSNDSQVVGADFDGKETEKIDSGVYQVAYCYCDLIVSGVKAVGCIETFMEHYGLTDFVLFSDGNNLTFLEVVRDLHLVDDRFIVNRRTY